MSDKRGEEGSSGERAAISSKKLLGDLTHKKIKYYLSKNRVSEKELYSVFKDFFRELLEIKKEYTCTELIKELDTVFLQNNTRSQITTFIKKISVVEFKDNAFDDKETRVLFEELDEIVTAVIKFSGAPTEKGFFATIFGLFKKEKDEPFIAELENEAEDLEPEKEIEHLTRRGKEKKAKVIEEEFAPLAPSEEKEIEDSGLNELDQQFEVQDLSETEKKEVDEEQVEVAEELAKEEPKHKTKYELPPDDWAEPVKEKKQEPKDDPFADLDDSIDVEVPVEEKKKSTKKEKKSKKKKEDKKIEEEKDEPSTLPLTEEELPPPPTLADTLSEDIPDVAPQEEKPEDINKLIKQAKKLKKKDMLEESYQKIIEIYNAFDDDDQDKYYDDIQALYDKIQNAKE